jgi:hypothetical protein
MDLIALECGLGGWVEGWAEGPDFVLRSAKASHPFSHR